MKHDIRMRLGALLAMMLLLSMAFVPAVSAEVSEGDLNPITKVKLYATYELNYFAANTPEFEGWETATIGEPVLIYDSTGDPVLYDVPIVESGESKGIIKIWAKKSMGVPIYSASTHVIEPSAGVDRIALALLCQAYTVEWVPAKGNTDASPITPEHPGDKPPEGYEERTTMRFAPSIAPVKVAVFPLLKNKPALVERARTVFDELSPIWPCFWDQVGAIGRRYRRQDEIGTPFAVTVDFDTLEDDTVTLRDRDTMQQERVAANELVDILRGKLT